MTTTFISQMEGLIMQLKNTITKLKSMKLYKPIMVVGLVGIAVILVWGSATVAKVVIDASYETTELATNQTQNNEPYEFEEDMFEETLTGNARGGTKVSILKKEGETVREVGYDNGDELNATQQDPESVNLGQATEMNNLEYNIVKQILAELSKDSTDAGVTSDQMADISNKYDVSMAEIENLVKKYQSQNATDAETIKSELGITEQQLKTMIKQIETNVTNNQKSLEQKISSQDKKTTEMIANSQTLTDKQIKELASKIGVSDKDLRDYIDKKNKETLSEAKTAADTAAKAAVSPKADKTYVDQKIDDTKKIVDTKVGADEAAKLATNAANKAASSKADKSYVDEKMATKITMEDAKKAAEEVAAVKADKTYVDDQMSSKITKDDLKNENVVTATYDETTNTLTFSQVN